MLQFWAWPQGIPKTCTGSKDLTEAVLGVNGSLKGWTYKKGWQPKLFNLEV